MTAPLTTAPSRPGRQAEAHDTEPPSMNGKAIRQWPRDRWLEAIWESETLTANERIVAYAYARYAGRNEVSWCQWDELRRRTGIRSRDAIHRAIKGLVAAGWLNLIEAAKQHYSARYRLSIPSQQSGRRTPGAGEASASSPGDGHLDPSGSPPAVRETDIPVVRETKPAVRETDPSTQTDHSDLQQGGTLPPRPPATQPGASAGLDRTHDPLTAVPHYNDTKKVTSRTRTRAETNNRPLLAIIDNPKTEPIPTINQPTTTITGAAS